MPENLKTRMPLLLAVILMLAGCASASVFRPYPVQMQPIKQQVSQGQFSDAQTQLEKYRHDADRILYLMERGRVSQISDDIPTSIEDFRQVIHDMEVNEEKARITLTGTAAKGSSLLVNDNAIPYTGKAYERIFVHQFQALNYLLQQNVEAALVEARRANLQQAIALDEHEKEQSEIDEQARQYKDANKDFMDAFAEMEEIASRVKSSFQNAYSFYTAGLIYEIMGELNDAYIDYKKALEIYPDNVYVQADVLRLARQLDMADDIEFYTKRFGAGLKGLEAKAPASNEGEIVVLYEQGFAPVKLETKVGLFSGRHLYHVAFPYYPGQWQPEFPLSVNVLGGGNPGQLNPVHHNLGQTQPIVSVQALAVKALQEELSGMMLRQILRIVSKREMSEQARKNTGLAGQIVVEIFNAVTENADRRSWLTLPGNAQILRSSLLSGEYQLRLNSGAYGELVTVRVEAGRKTVIRVIETGGILRTRALVL